MKGLAKALAVITATMLTCWGCASSSNPTPTGEKTSTTTEAKEKKSEEILYSIPVEAPRLEVTKKPGNFHLTAVKGATNVPLGTWLLHGINRNVMVAGIELESVRPMRSIEIRSEGALHGLVLPREGFIQFDEPIYIQAGSTAELELIGNLDFAAEEGSWMCKIKRLWVVSMDNFRAIEDVRMPAENEKVIIIKDRGKLAMAGEKTQPFLAYPGQAIILGKVRLTARDESVRIQGMSLSFEQINSSCWTMIMHSVSIWEEEEKICEQSPPVASPTFFRFDREVLVEKGEHKEYTIKAQITSECFSLRDLSGKGIKTKIDEIEAIGVVSNKHLSLVGESPSRTFIVHQSVPRISVPMPEKERYQSGIAEIYNFEITSKGGEIGIRKITIDLATNKIAKKMIKDVFLQNEKREIVSEGTVEKEQLIFLLTPPCVIEKDQKKVFSVRAFINLEPGEIFCARLLGDQKRDVPRSAAEIHGNFVWTDFSKASPLNPVNPEVFGAAQWMNGYAVASTPTPWIALSY